MIPMCKVLNFQKFIYLTYPILVSVVLMFVCLITNLLSRIVYGFNDDFCTIVMNDNGSIPSAEIGITYANVIPSLCFAFGFQIYMLQVHKVLNRKDPNGYNGMKIGLWALSIMFLIYLSLILIILAYEEPHHGNQVIYVYDLIFNAGTLF